ncbi:MAG: tRNA (adenosine(37)-N6)-threonylcarbamoyltransferase complex transferase subunit TsaD [bacterium]
MARILGIESSCDETAVCVLGENEVLAELVASQDDIHGSYGGVVPELASRAHLERLGPMIEQSLSESGLGMKDLDAVAVTAGPGLVVCLLVGLMTAKGICLGLDVPLVGVNHLDGHLWAIFMDREVEPPGFPYLGLVVSGGHSSLYLVKARGVYRQLGQTLDDAAGEAFDKSAKVLGLPYPGGRQIEELSRQGDETAIPFPRPLLDRQDYNFSFSGLKTAVIHYFEKTGRADSEKPDIAASFQAAAVEVLVKKTLRAASDFKVNDIVVSGGVAANQRLRDAFLHAGDEAGFKVKFPSMRLCTDNAVMIAGAGVRILESGTKHGLDLPPRAVWPL